MTFEADLRGCAAVRGLHLHGEPLLVVVDDVADGAEALRPLAEQGQGTER